MRWAFWRKPLPPPLKDVRDWNDDWKVGDIAECVVDGINVIWSDGVEPWNRPKFRQHLTVSGFAEAKNDNKRFYVLKFSDWPVSLETRGFRKARPQVSEKSEVVERILTATPGKDKVREPSE